MPDISKIIISFFFCQEGVSCSSITSATFLPFDIRPELVIFASAGLSNMGWDHPCQRVLPTLNQALYPPPIKKSLSPPPWAFSYEYLYPYKYQSIGLLDQVSVWKLTVADQWLSKWRVKKIKGGGSGPISIFHLSFFIFGSESSFRTRRCQWQTQKLEKLESNDSIDRKSQR